MSDINIPIELIAEILKRVPAKSLVCFTSVCKSWYFLITSSNFIKIHLNHQISITTSKEEARFPIYKYNSVLCYESNVIYYNNDEFRRQYDYVVHPNTTSDAKPAGFCDGILCLTDHIKVCLWNPCLKKYLALRMPHNFDVYNGIGEKYVHGFGFNASKNDYKIVSIAYWSGSGKTKSIDVYMYSINSSAWKVVKGSFSWDGSYEVCGRIVHLNGVIHWVVGRLCFKHYVPAFILPFDLVKETFSHIQLPNHVVYDGLTFEVIRESECYDWVELMTLKRNGEEVLAVLRSDLENLTLWVMDDNGVDKSWREEFATRRNVKCRSIENVKMNGGIVMIRKVQKMASIDLKRLRIKQLSDQKMNYVGSYVESLVLLKPVKTLWGATCGKYFR